MHNFQGFSTTYEKMSRSDYIPLLTTNKYLGTRTILTSLDHIERESIFGCFRIIQEDDNSLCSLNYLEGRFWYPNRFFNIRLFIVHKMKVIIQDFQCFKQMPKLSADDDDMLLYIPQPFYIGPQPF